MELRAPKMTIPRLKPSPLRTHFALPPLGFQPPFRPFAHQKVALAPPETIKLAVEFKFSFADGGAAPALGPPLTLDGPRTPGNEEFEFSSLLSYAAQNILHRSPQRSLNLHLNFLSSVGFFTAFLIKPKNMFNSAL
ncbi:hypothetical protein L596_011304 [Steinernema carpocapsae]|uniref:Uncharacterized protein n=1 Tax=Steinernema carpocapsae TaxID=34508 RepID=A0A4U5NTX8_STECR|nr:hypothetical protein L596_011304 [Steinernema carpocapsae]